MAAIVGLTSLRKWRDRQEEQQRVAAEEREQAWQEELASRPVGTLELRLDGVENVGQVRYAFLEPSGQLSIFKYEDAAHRPGMSTLVFDG